MFEYTEGVTMSRERMILPLPESGDDEKEDKEERLYPVVGPGVDEEMMRSVNWRLRWDREERLREWNWTEAVKTKTDKEQLALVNKLIAQEVQKLGVSAPESVALDQVYFYTGWDWQRHSEPGALGHAIIIDGTIHMDASPGLEAVEQREWLDLDSQVAQRRLQELRQEAAARQGSREPLAGDGRVNASDQDSSAEQYVRERINEEKKRSVLDREALLGQLRIEVMLHESLHLAGFQKYRVDPKNKGYDLARTGYRTVSPGASVETESGATGLLFNSLNEATVQRMTLELMRANIDEISPDYRLRKQELAKRYRSGPYAGDIALLTMVLSKVARHRGEKIAETWRRFKTGYLQGDMMHLRDFDKVLGKGALRVYANVVANDRDSQEAMYDYIQSDSSTEREALAQEVFEIAEAKAQSKGTRQKLLYTKRRRKRRDSDAAG